MVWKSQRQLLRVLENSKSNKSSSRKALEKAKATSFGKGSEAKALEKAKAKAKSMKALEKAKLTKKYLEKCGSLSLTEKMQLATEEAEDEEDAAVNLKGKMTKLESSRVWQTIMLRDCIKAHNITRCRRWI